MIEQIIREYGLWIALLIAALWFWVFELPPRCCGGFMKATEKPWGGTLVGGWEVVYFKCKKCGKKINIKKQ